MLRKIFYLSILILCAASTSIEAQSRIAFLDASKILKRMPEAIDAESRLQTLVNGWNRDASEMQAELDRKRNEYDRKKLIMTDGERSAIEIDMADIKSRLDKFRQDKYGPSGELFSQQTSLMQPAYDKLKKIIDEIAVEGKFDYVFDRNSKDYGMLYSNAKFDLTLQVAKKLGIETSDVFSVPLLDKSNPNAPNRSPNPHSNMPQQTPPPPGTIVQPK